MSDSPRLWLRCGSCPKSNLAALRLDDVAANGIRGAIEPRRVSGRWAARPDDTEPLGWVHEFECKQCGTQHHVGEQEISERLGQFTATGLQRGTWYLPNR